MRKTIKRLGAVLLAMAMAVSVLCTGALAADTTYSITVKPAVSRHTYEAYQVFTGTVATGEDKKKVLSDIQWGSGVNSTELVKELQSTDNNPFGSDFSKKNTAADIAAVVADYDSDKIKKFATVVGKHLQTTAAGTSGEFDSTNQIYTISGLSAGYYLVKDKDGSVDANNHDVYTNYIMEVVQDVTVEPKISVPTVEKKVNNKTEADIAQIGEKVTFTLTGTLPKNYDDYKTYQYIFHDTLSEGLTLDANSITVKAYKNDTDVETLAANAGYTILTGNGVSETNDPKCSLEIKFDNLKNISGLTENSKIVVEYTATVNSKATAGKTTPNTNKVHLEYSNDPNAEGEGTTGKTPEDKVNVYTFELDVTKVDAQSENTKLSDAQFVLATADNLNFTADNFNEKGEATENTTTTDLIAVTGSTPNYVINDGTATSKMYVMSTDTNGALNINGLKSGTYYLYETKAPDGYNKLTKPIKIEITATQTENTGDIAETNAFSAKVDKTATTATLGTGIVSVTVKNSSGSTLPSTGGMGTKLFYTIGGILMAGAAIVLVVRKRRSDAE